MKPDALSSAEPHPIQAAAVKQGTLVEWVDAKGYGWVKSGDKRFFAHIKDFERGARRPRAGEEVRFVLGNDSQGRSCARSVTLVRSGARVGMGAWLWLLVLLVLPLLVLLRLPLPWWQGIGAMAFVSAITYQQYAHDKRQAVSGGRRVPESSLHLLELLGGWPGAWIAQRRLRHKCVKLSYLVIFWLIVMLFQLAAADVLLGHRPSRFVISLIRSHL